MSLANQQTRRPASRTEWAAFVSEHALPARPEYRRRHPRRAFIAPAKTAYQPAADIPKLGHCLVMEITDEDLTLRSRVRIPPRTLLAVRISSGQRSLLLYGEVIHCTQTVGAYKIGVRLTFPETPPKANRPSSQPAGPGASS